MDNTNCGSFSRNVIEIQYTAVCDYYRTTENRKWNGISRNEIFNIDS